MKKAISLILSAVLVLACLVSCSGHRLDKTGIKEDAIPKGGFDGKSYINKYLGITYEFADGWTVISGSQIDELNGITSDMTEVQAKERLDSIKIICDIQAGRADGSASMSISVEDLNKGYTAKTGEKEYSGDMLTRTKKNLEGRGFEDLKVETTEFTLAGRKHPANRVSYKFDHRPYKQTTGFVKYGRYMVSFTVTTYNGSDPDDILAQFRAL